MARSSSQEYKWARENNNVGYTRETNASPYIHPHGYSAPYNHSSQGSWDPQNPHYSSRYSREASSHVPNPPLAPTISAEDCRRSRSRWEEENISNSSSRNPHSAHVASLSSRTSTASRYDIDSLDPASSDSYYHKSPPHRRHPHHLVPRVNYAASPDPEYPILQETPRYSSSSSTYRIIPPEQQYQYSALNSGSEHHRHHRHGPRSSTYHLGYEHGDQQSHSIKIGSNSVFSETRRYDDRYASSSESSRVSSPGEVIQRVPVFYEEIEPFTRYI